MGGDVEIDAPHVVGNRQAGLGAQHRLVDHPGLIGALDDDLPPQFLVAVGDLHDPECLPLGRGQFRIHERLQRFVVDPHRLSGADRRRMVLGGDDRHRLAPESGLPVGQHRLIIDVLPEGAPAGNVVDGEHGPHTGHRQCRPRVDRHDPGPGMRAAKRDSPQHAIHLGVA